MKKDHFASYSRKTVLSDERELIRTAFKNILYSQHRHFRVGDIVKSLSDTHPCIEFNSVKTARHIFEMGKENVWTCEEIDGVLYPTCFPRCDCTALVVYKPQLALT